MPREVPTAYDVERFLFANGMIAATPTVVQEYLDLTLAADAAYKDFQDATGIHPFFAETANTTKYYNAQGPFLKLPPYAAITSVTTGRRFETSSETKTATTDFEYVYDEDTIIGLDFNLYYPGRVGVTGRRGWSDDLPANVFQAIQGRAAGVHLRPSLAAAINAGAIEWREGDVQEKYGPMGAYSLQADVWESHWKMTVARYKQLEISGR